jgi:hypothetical protein
MAAVSVQTPRNERFVFGGRLVIGLAQGLALYFLYYAFEHKTWPATDGQYFAPALLVALFVPLLAVQALGNIRRTTLILWSILAAAVVGLFGWYDIWHGWPTEFRYPMIGSSQEAPRVVPAVATFFAAMAFLFIGHALVVAADIDRKILATYRTHFDTAWKQGLQLVLAGVFVGIFWTLLWLGAALFKLINLDFLEKLIRHNWFAIPVTTLAVAAALHITDVRAVLVRGARTLVLALFSWLLPLIALIAAGFLASLVFTGLTPLWNTRFATGLLLASAGWIIVLINAAYQDGADDHRPVLVLRIAVRIGGVLLVPMVTLAAYALYLRIAQYGWTVDRISAVACVAVAATHAAGYGIAAVWRKTWFKPLERWNFAAAVLILLVIAALFSPIADPARISVASQVARLESGKVTPQKFDFYYLHRDGGRFGRAALERLAASQNPLIAGPAKDALTQRYVRFTPPPAPEPAKLAKRFKVHPVGTALPDSFVRQNWRSDRNSCFNDTLSEGRVCDVVIVDIAGSQDVIVISSFGENTFRQMAFYRLEGSEWKLYGERQGTLCDADYHALLGGRFAAIAPRQQDIQVNGRRLAFEPPRDDSTCP